jgi:hypothetical protein
MQALKTQTDLQLQALQSAHQNELKKVLQKNEESNDQINSMRQEMRSLQSQINSKEKQHQVEVVRSTDQMNMLRNEFKTLQAKVEKMGQQPKFGVAPDEPEEVKQQDIKKTEKKKELPERTALEKEVIKLIEEEPANCKTYKRSKKPTLELFQRPFTKFGDK